MTSDPMSRSMTPEVEALVGRLRKATDSDAVYDGVVRLREQTKSDLPRLAMANAFDMLDEERAEAADMIERLAALSASAQEPGWRTMESAPKDGSAFLATGGGCGEEVLRCRWIEPTGAWDCEIAVLEDWDDQAEGYSRPKFWQPLPTAPSANAGGDAC